MGTGVCQERRVVHVVCLFVLFGCFAFHFVVVVYLILFCLFAVVCLLYLCCLLMLLVFCNVFCIRSYVFSCSPISLCFAPRSAACALARHWQSRRARAHVRARVGMRVSTRMCARVRARSEQVALIAQ